MDETQGSDAERAHRFTEVFRAHHGHVSAYARRRLGADLAQDAVAETFTTAWRRLDDLTGEPLPWLYALAAHAVANQRRSTTRRTRLDERARTVLRDESHEPDHADVVAETDSLARAFLALNEKDREVLRLSSWECLDPDDAAAVLGCSRKTFNVRLHRARGRLTALLDAQPADLPAPAALVRTEETS